MASENVYIDNRMIYLSDSFNKETVGKMNFQLIKLIKEDDEKDKTTKDYKREPIHIYISSYGGSVYDLLGLMNAVLTSKTPIYTYVKGYAMSAGFWLFICGHKRFIGKYDTLMYHQTHFTREGTYQDFLDDRKEMDWFTDVRRNLILERTKITQKRLEEVQEKKIDWYIHADEAIELGCADEIY